MLRRGFSLVELVIAMGIGMFVALTAYTAFRTAAQAIAVTNRLALENQLMRAGIDQALEQADFWTDYDDPDDPAGQPLRLTTTRDTLYGPAIQEAGAFAPFHLTPVARDWNPPSPDHPQPYAALASWQIRASEPLLETPAQLRDPVRLTERDADRGWDARRPYVAADPRGWYRGNLAEEGRSDKRAGRYAMRANKRRFPTLGFGEEPRELGGWSREARLGSQAPTGPFGLLTASDALPATWHDNQLTFLHQALGYYGMMDYLPSNTVYGSYGTWLVGRSPDPGSILEPGWPAAYTTEALAPIGTGGIALWSDERLDFRFTSPSSNNLSGTNFAYTGWVESPRGGGHASNRLGSGARTSLYQSGYTHPLLPRSRYTGLFNIPVTRDTSANNAGYLSTPFWSLRDEFSFYSHVDNATSANTSLNAATWMEMQRYRWPGEQAQPFHLNQVWQRATMLRPVARQRPASWPELHLSQARLLFRSRFMHLCSVRWTDTRTGEVAELRFSTLGTTLRGARQQRHREQGWAAWHGPDSPLNDPTLDSPTP